MNTSKPTHRMATTPSPTGLFWSERGHVACAAHTPLEGSDTWLWERCEAVPEEAVTAADGGHVLRCETCGGVGKHVLRS